MLTESLVGVMAMIAAATLEPGVYFAMNVCPATLGTTSETAALAIAQWDFTVNPAQLDALARQMGEATLPSHTGGARSRGHAGHPRRRRRSRLVGRRSSSPTPRWESWRTPVRSLEGSPLPNVSLILGDHRRIDARVVSHCDQAQGGARA